MASICDWSQHTFSSEKSVAFLTKSGQVSFRSVNRDRSGSNAGVFDRHGTWFLPAAGRAGFTPQSPVNTHLPGSRMGTAS